MSSPNAQHADLTLLDSLLDDVTITEIMVNGMDGVYIEQRGQIIKTGICFESEDHILRVIGSLLVPTGREITTRTPIVDARLPDGSRVNAVIRPIAVTGPALTVRKYSGMDLTWDQLIHFGAVSAQVVEFLRACVQARINVVVAGGTNAGKTTIMNALSEFIPASERVISAEVAAELRLRHDHVVSLETRASDAEGKGAITITDIIANAERMRPDRIIFGEVRGGEAWDMLQLMSLGFDGSMFTIHSNSAHDALERLEMMAVVAASLPLLQVRAKIVQGIDLITQNLRLADGSRKIIAVTEVVGLKNNVIETQDIFRFEPVEETADRTAGEFRRTGYVPTFAPRLGLPVDFFNVEGA